MMLTNKKPSQFSPLALAYIGDGVYELFVRTKVIEEHENLPANKLHKKTVQYVKAHAQSNSIDAMLPHLTEDETAVYKRGRNAKSNTTPKNADMADYRKATGFEALIGFLEVSGADGRLEEIIEKTFEIIENEKIIVNRR